MNQKSSGIHAIYDIINNKWVVKPSHFNIKVDYTKINQFVTKITRRILKNKNNLSVLLGIKLMLGEVRQLGLLGIGEYSVLNLAYKLLRNKKVLLLLKLYIKKLEGNSEV